MHNFECFKICLTREPFVFPSAPEPLHLSLLTAVYSVSPSHPVHVKEEPTEVEEDSRPVSLLAGVTHSLPDERDLEEDLPTEELE